MIEALKERAKQLLRIQTVAGSYRTLFASREPGTPAAHVLTDLRAFCWPMGRERKPVTDVLELARLDGRREVFERILTLSLGSQSGIEREIAKLREQHGD